MASKFFESFKKFPQQIPKFKKGSEKSLEGLFANYNISFGELSETSSFDFDGVLNLLAVGHETGEIKLYGFPGHVRTLIYGSKSVKLLKFIPGEGRLISLYANNLFVTWEYNKAIQNWEVVEHNNLTGEGPSDEVVALEVSKALAEKSPSDDSLHLLLIAFSSQIIKQGVITGGKIHLYNDPIFTRKIVESCGLDEGYELGDINTVAFNKNNLQLTVCYTNGLITLFEADVKEPVIEAPAPETTETEEKPKEEDKSKEAEIVNGHTSDEKKDEEKEAAEEVKEEQKDDKESEAKKEDGEKEDKKEETEEEKKEKEEKVEKDEKEEKVEKVEKDEKDDKENKKDDKKEKEAEKPKVEEAKVEEPKHLPYLIVNKPKFIAKCVTEKILSACWVEDDIYYLNGSNGGLNCCSLDESKTLTSTNVVKLSDSIIESVFPLKGIKFQGNTYLCFVNKEKDLNNKLIILKNGEIFKETSATSPICHYEFLNIDEDADTSEAIVSILSENALRFGKITADPYVECQCPYFQLSKFEEIRTISEIVKVPSLLFDNHSNVTTLFKDIPIKTPLEETEEAYDDSYIDIFATGHSDGVMVVWQIIASSVLHELYRFDTKDILNETLDEARSSLLPITAIQVVLQDEARVSMLMGNQSGIVFSFDFSASVDNDVTDIEIESRIQNLSDSDGVSWNDSESLKLIDIASVKEKYSNISYVVRVEPSLPVSVLAYQPGWNLLGIGCTYGVAIVDFTTKSTLFTYSTLHRTPKVNEEAEPPLTMGQQLRKSMRQSFRKLKKLKPSGKHSYNVSDDKKAKESEAKTEKEEKSDKKEEEVKDGEEKDKEKEKKEEETEKGEEKPEVTEEKEKAEVKEEAKEEVKEEVKEENETKEESAEPSKEQTAAAADQETVTEVPPETKETNEVHEPELIPIEISRSDKSISRVSAILLITTNSKTVTKTPTMFVGTNEGAVYVFEMVFSEDNMGIKEIKLSKELHLQHKAPVLYLGVIDYSNAPLLDWKQQIGTFQRINTTVEISESHESVEGIAEEKNDVGPSGDSPKVEKIESTEEGEEKEKSGTLPKSDDKVEITEPRKSVDGTNEKGTFMGNLKKSGTLPASFLQAIGKNAIADNHELIVVSEEQVKLFALPSLKARSKHKVVDTGHHFSHSKSTSSTTTTSNTASTNNDANVQQEEGESNKKPIRKITSIGLHRAASKSDKWVAVVSLANGEFVSLNLSNLKKISSNYYTLSTGCHTIVSKVSSGATGLITSHDQKSHSIQVTDVTVFKKHIYEPIYQLVLPNWARPEIKVVEAETAAAAVEQKTTDEENKEEAVKTNGEQINGHKTDEIEEEEGKDKLGSETVIHQTTNATPQPGDVTMDSIKEYITNMDGNITVKTYESSTEKHITVDGGKIETTIHEKQVDDGQVVKDDVVKITSDAVGSSN